MNAAVDATPATPKTVRFAVWLTFFNTWVLFEETVVDRYGLWQYMPLYRVARLCAWDVGAAILIAIGLRWLLGPHRALPNRPSSIR